jgi:peroxin-4
MKQVLPKFFIPNTLVSLFLTLFFLQHLSYIESIPIFILVFNKIIVLFLIKMSKEEENDDIKKIRSQKGLERILSEYEYIKKKKGLNKIGGSVGIIKKQNGNEKDYFHWKACFIGPKNTPYENGLYFIELKLDDGYPATKPLARFRTRIFHPNVNWCSGQICLDYIKSNWSTNNTLRDTILCIFNLLKNPVFNSALNGDTNKDGKEAPDFKEKARNYRQQYAFQSQKYNWNDNYTNWTESSFPILYN